MQRAGRLRSTDNRGYEKAEVSCCHSCLPLLQLDLAVDPVEGEWFLLIFHYHYRLLCGGESSCGGGNPLSPRTRSSGTSQAAYGSYSTARNPFHQWKLPLDPIPWGLTGSKSDPCFFGCYLPGFTICDALMGKDAPPEFFPTTWQQVPYPRISFQDWNVVLSLMYASWSGVDRHTFT